MSSSLLQYIYFFLHLTFSCMIVIELSIAEFSLQIFILTKQSTFTRGKRDIKECMNYSKKISHFILKFVFFFKENLSQFRT